MPTPIRTSKHLTLIPQAQLHTWDSAELSIISLMFMSRPSPPTPSPPLPPPPTPEGEKQE
jgi:hypothetical protein